MKAELKKLTISAYIPILLILIIIAVKLIEYTFEISLSSYGIVPISLQGLSGIIFAPFLHIDLKHVISNCVPLFVTGTALFYYYKEFANRAFIFMFLLTGFLTWLMGRNYSTHIGASGIVYALIFFHISSAIIRQRRDLTAFSFIVILLYGSVFWGFFPDFFPERNISWESHLSGAITGIIFAIFYKNKGPQKIVHIWEDNDNEDDDEFYLENINEDKAENNINTNDNNKNLDVNI